MKNLCPSVLSVVKKFHDRVAILSVEDAFYGLSSHGYGEEVEMMQRKINAWKKDDQAKPTQLWGREVE